MSLLFLCLLYAMKIKAEKKGLVLSVLHSSISIAVVIAKELFVFYKTQCNHYIFLFII